jgi:hypothetical protein
MQKEFVNVILEILSPMSNVNVIKNKGHIVLYKDGAMFGVSGPSMSNFTVSKYCILLRLHSGFLAFCLSAVKSIRCLECKILHAI